MTKRKRRYFNKSSLDNRVRQNKCLKCGKLGSHFVPPSLGDDGFFICEAMSDNG